ncbi:MAG: sigma-54 factor interaction domain-containing protein [Chromatiales bacterium]|nr:sigma-54 factor interaction domain-containing protein [Chromatiales bacterium]
MQSELFGFEKGASTGRPSIQNRAYRGSWRELFLDEIGDLPIEMQVNLLRFFQENHSTGGQRKRNPC